MFSSGLYYLCPFNIEYHIFVSALLFVMWKNIGRNLDQQTKQKHVSTGGSCLLLGPILGLLALASSITVLTIYIIHVEESVYAREAAISMFYLFGIVILTCMSMAGAVGLLIYRVEDWPMDTAPNPARTLDAKLLLGSSVGSWLLCWCSVVSVSGAQNYPSYRWSNLAFALLLVLEKCVQNLFVIESLYRRRREPGESPSHSSTPEIFSVAAAITPPYDGIVNHAFETPDKNHEVLESSKADKDAFDKKTKDVSLTVGHGNQDTPSRKRQALKNIAIFLFMSNISVRLFTIASFTCLWDRLFGIHGLGYWAFLEIT